jgi:beta-xylosidase
MRKYINILLFIIIIPVLLFSQPSNKWGDQGNGTYRNFILWTELSNPDVVRVGDDFYMVTSTIHLSPSIAVYHSRDLVNWQIIGHVVSDITEFSPKYGFDKMEGQGYGAWAATLRYYNKKFWMYIIDPSEGLFMSTAQKAEGPWTKLFKVSDKLKNHDDCCPIWDDNGEAYLSCADFSKKRPNSEYQIRIFKMSENGQQLLDTGFVAYKGRIAEATKLYKIDSYYYLMFTEQLADRMQRIMRSKSIYGPYEVKTALMVNKDDPYKPITQGSLVQLADKKWMYIGQSNYTTIWGWPTALLPVHWVNGWPLIGTDSNNDGIGEMYWNYTKPIKSNSIYKPQSTDEFNTEKLQPQWEFNFQPMPNAYSLKARKGYLRLNAFKTLNKNPWSVRNVMLQRIIGQNGKINVELETAQMANGQNAGICGFGAKRVRLIVERKADDDFQVKLENENDSTIIGESFKKLDKIWFRISHTDQIAEFSYSTDNKTFIQFEKQWKLSRWSWLGTRFGIMTWNNNQDDGFVDFNWFRYKYN